VGEGGGKGHLNRQTVKGVGGVFTERKHSNDDDDHDDDDD
jgi:hypothetical protein